METQPLVSVPVITYNSSKYVLETLESIKAQTYQNIELIISDDCSTDNTVEICREWIEQNKSRFIRTVLLEAPINTGISANCNRAEAVCQGEWVKPIAGDDILMPECIEKCTNYVNNHPDTVYLFGKVSTFGSDANRCKKIEENFDYSFFSLSIEQQLHHLIYNCNCIPASTAFYNVQIVKSLQIFNDERIPLLEDWPKWINLLKAGVRFVFVDATFVKYRVGGISTTHFTNDYFRSKRLFFFYYQYPEMIQEEPNLCINTVVDYECDLYRKEIELEEFRNKVMRSFLYKCYLVVKRLFKNHK